MIDSIKGLLERKDIASAVILANGVGFKVNMSINALEDLPQPNNEVRLFVAAKEVETVDGYAESENIEKCKKTLTIIENIESIDIEITDEMMEKINSIHNNNPNPSP